MFIFNISEWNLTNMIIRIVLALLLGMLIGLNRESMRRMAGIKTNSVVCLGAALVMMTAQYMESVFPGSSDMARLAAQVISGVGFLGVGTIIVSGRRVKGLTTAASLWACACIGLAVGIGFADGAVLITLCLLVIFWIYPRIERFILKKSHFVNLYVEIENVSVMPRMMSQLKERGISVEDFEILNARAKKEPVMAQLLLRLEGSAEQFSRDELLDIEGVLSVL